MKQFDSGSPVRNVRWIGQAAIVEVAGDIDINRSNDFQQALLAVLDEKPERIIVHLGAVPYMDSSGVASLVKLLSRARKANIKVFLVQLCDRVRSIFEITRLDNVFSICKTEQEALN
jgi:anti-sigma B factor antagonist